MNAEFFKQIPPGLISGIIYTCDFKDPDSFFVNEQFEVILGYPHIDSGQKFGVRGFQGVQNPDHDLRDRVTPCLVGDDRQMTGFDLGIDRFDDIHGGSTLVVSALAQGLDDLLK